MVAPLEADYVVVGCGAVGMAFADTLVRHSNSTVIMADRNHRPGGHWNHAYPFVRLHLPSHFYGSESLELGDRSIIRSGHNAGLLQMASGAEVQAYYERLMERVLLPTGRVTFLPMTEGGFNGTVKSLMTGKPQSVRARKKWVDATYTPSPVPATYARNFRVANDVNCVPINQLPSLGSAPARYCVIGSGKTGMDACVWLLDQGVEPDRIRWIMPRDAWWVDRSRLQWSEDRLDDLLNFMTSQMESLSEATSTTDLFLAFEHRGIAHRIDPGRLPTMSHNATITKSELAALRRITDIVRMGRVRAIERDRIVLESGEVAARPDTVYIDCAATGLTANPPVPIFAEKKITLQLVRLLRPCLSGSVIGFLEATLESDEEKNALAAPVPMPCVPDDWPRMTAASMKNQAKAAQYPALMAWLGAHRLDPGSLLLNKAASDPARKAMMDRLKAAMQAGVANLPRLLATIDAQANHR